MSYQLCGFCDRQSSVAECHCGFGGVIGCTGEPACDACSTAHKQIGGFLKNLFGTRRAERSNSVRQRLLMILIEALATVRGNFQNLPTRVEFAFRSLRELSAFSGDHEFRAVLDQALGVMPAKVFSVEFAKALEWSIAKCKAEASLERFGIAVADVPQEFRAGIAEFLNQLVADTQPPAPAPCGCSKCRRGSAGRSSGARVTARGRFSSRSFYE